MVTLRKIKTYWTEVHRTVQGDGSDPQVKVTTCCCAKPGATPAECSATAGHKTRCRCNCHRKAQP